MPPEPRAIPTAPARPLLKDRRLHVSFEGRLALIALAGGAPAVFLCVYLLNRAGLPVEVYWTLLVIAVGSWLSAVLVFRERLSQSLRTISNILMAFREGDYSLRATKAHRDDPLGEILVELNLFAETLRSGRLNSVEATLLLDQVIDAVDVGIFVFDDAQRLRLLNPAGAALIDRIASSAIGCGAAELGLEPCFVIENSTAVELHLAPGPARYMVRRGAFRSDGLPHTFLTLSNVSLALRLEERDAWRKLVRVLGHEINNSLSPIKSMAGALGKIVRKDPLPHDWREDLEEALEVIESRAEALRRFTLGYATLARLPEPRKSPVDFAALARRAAGLETRLAVAIESGPSVSLTADTDQLEQVLINLLRNAVDAALEEHGEVRLTWRVEGAWFTVEITDSGPGILNPDNLFVPFFTTKPGGTGIGLPLCRQIIEAHGGDIALENRADTRGARVRIRLPL